VSRSAGSGTSGTQVKKQEVTIGIVTRDNYCRYRNMRYTKSERNERYPGGTCIGTGIQ
jgi:hypothetical protein